MNKLLLLATLSTLSFSLSAREPEAGWKQLGTGTFCDDMISVISPDYLATWNVDIEESESQPGMYRLVNPFGNGNCPYFESAFNGGDLVIDATDPEHVWIPYQEMGFAAGSWGSVSISCMNGLMIYSGVFTLEDLIEFECLFGTLSDGKITFPFDDMYHLQVALSNYLEGVPADGNTNGKFLVTLPSSASVDSPIVDSEAPVEYYNLQGMRVENPANGIYIRRQGSKATKVVL